MNRKKWRTRLACVALTAVTITGVAVAAGTQGSESDPLVTLGYLQNVLTPDLMQMVDERIAERSAELEQRLKQGGETVFLTVEVPAGKIVTLSAGTQFIPRAGTASNVDGVIDLTGGTGIWGNLALNHLYIATADGQKLAVTANATFLILGRYTVN